MARVAAPFGIKGWLKVYSYAEPPESLLDFPVWKIGAENHWQEHRLLRSHDPEGGPLLTVQLEGVTDRDQAASLRGCEIAVEREALDDLPEDEYYWADLIGLAVVDTQGTALGIIEKMIETGANDVLVVQGERERLIPYIRPEVVRQVDLDAGKLVVDWDRDF